VDISMELDIHIDIDHVIKESTHLIGRTRNNNCLAPMFTRFEIFDKNSIVA
jgi:hypothetical protein